MTDAPPGSHQVSAPGRTTYSLPMLSWCSTSPESSQVTVWRPVWGWGGTTIPGSEAPVAGMFVP